MGPNLSAGSPRAITEVSQNLLKIPKRVPITGF